MALLAGGQISLIQSIVMKEATGPAAHALRFFAYSTILVATGGTALALALIKLCTELPLRAKDLLVLDSNSVPAKLSRGEPLQKQVLLHETELLRAFGMPRVYIWLDWGSAATFICSLVMIFASLTIWVWVSEPWFVAMPITIMLIPAVAMGFSFFATLSE